MAGLAGILSSDILNLQKRVRWMLAWCEKEGEQCSFYEQKWCAVGSCSQLFLRDEATGITVALTGKLIRQNELLERLNLTDLEDTQLIIKAYEAYGTDCFREFFGNFLILIIDEKRGEIHLARDRFGSFDLFWVENAHGIFFSTCLKALLSSQHVPISLDLESISSYLFLSYISQDMTAVSNVNRLLPGYFMSVLLEKDARSKITISPFWSFSAAFTEKKRELLETSEELYEKLTQKIKEAIQERHHASTYYPAVMSDGAGSKIIQEMFVRNSDAPPIPSVSIEFEGTNQPLQNPHAMIHISPEKFLKTLIPLSWSLDTPIANIDLVAEWYFCELCQKHNLTPYFDTGFETEFTHYTLSKKLAIEFPQTIFRSKAYRFFSALFPKVALKWLRLSQQKDPRVAFLEKEGHMTKQEFIEGAPLLAERFKPDLFLHQFYHLPRIHTEAASLFYLRTKTVVVDKLHTARSRLAAAFQLQPEAPFLDIRLLEFLAALDEEVWLSPDVLPLFHEAYLGYKVPPKKPINLDAWLKDPHIVHILERLKKGLAVESGFITPLFLEKIAKREVSNPFQNFYSVLMLEIWMRLYVDQPLITQEGKITRDDTLSLDDLLK